MNLLTRGIVASMAALSLAATAAAPALASNPEAATVHPNGSTTHKPVKHQEKITGNRYVYAKDVAYMSIKAAPKSGKTWDYRKLDKYDRKHSTLRRGFAAGLLMGGNKLSHISSAERTKVNKYVRHSRPRMTPLTPKPCLGDSGVYPIRARGTGARVGTEYRFNSCTARALTFATGGTGIGGAIAAGIAATGKLTIAKTLGPIGGAIFGVNAVEMAWARDASDIGAIKLSVWHSKWSWGQNRPGQGTPLHDTYFIVYLWLPQ